jgi:hypothetical protein
MLSVKCTKKEVASSRLTVSIHRESISCELQDKINKDPLIRVVFASIFKVSSQVRESIREM